MARKARAGDAATNARKRYYRDAERYLKLAGKTFGATSARYRSMARIRLQEALNTYTKATTQEFAKPIQAIANALGVDLNAQRDIMKQRTVEMENHIRERAIKQSGKATRKGLTDEQLRQREAQALFNTDIGSRIIGGTVELWVTNARIDTETGTKIDNKRILPILFEKFGVDNLADLIQKFTDIAGESLYSSVGNDAFYENAKVTIQTYVRKYML